MEGDHRKSSSRGIIGSFLGDLQDGLNEEMRPLPMIITGVLGSKSD